MKKFLYSLLIIAALLSVGTSVYAGPVEPNVIKYDR